MITVDVTGSFNFTPPVGPAGPIGPQGIQGMTGPQGPIGPSPVIDINALAAQVAAILAQGTPAPAPTPTPVPTSGTVYQDGILNWAGDYSYPVPPLKIDYKDISGAPKQGTYNIKVNPNGAQFGAWQPFANTQGSWDTSPYTTLNFDLKVNDPASQFQVQFLLVGDIPTGVSVPLAKYGQPLQAGIWTSFSIPLTDLGVAKKIIYKFAIQNIGSVQPWFVNNVRFS